jgi:glyoxalase/bleomycin resistance protein/dioxygenase superfamily protein
VTINAVGQPVGSLCQLSSIVPDLLAAIANVSACMQVGPWFVLERIPITGGLYRGQPNDVDVSLAIAFSGNLQIELIKDNSKGPSIFNEISSSKGYGVHHYGVLSRAFDSDRQRLNNLGYSEVFYAVNDLPARNVYFDTKGALPVFLELIEMTDRVELLFANMFRASQQWDGSDPIRPLRNLDALLS